jgi:hypothetical protein
MWMNDLPFVDLVEACPHDFYYFSRIVAIPQVQSAVWRGTKVSHCVFRDVCWPSELTSHGHITTERQLDTQEFPKRPQM